MPVNLSHAFWSNLYNSHFKNKSWDDLASYEFLKVMMHWWSKAQFLQFLFTCRLFNTEKLEKRCFGEAGSNDCLVSTHRKTDGFLRATVPCRVIMNSKDQQNIVITHYHLIKSRCFPEDSFRNGISCLFSSGHLRTSPTLALHQLL